MLKFPSLIHLTSGDPHAQSSLYFVREVERSNSYNRQTTALLCKNIYSIQ